MAGTEWPRPCLCQGRLDGRYPERRRDFVCGGYDGSNDIGLDGWRRRLGHQPRLVASAMPSCAMGTTYTQTMSISASERYVLGKTSDAKGKGRRLVIRIDKVEIDKAEREAIAEALAERPWP